MKHNSNVLYYEPNYAYSTLNDGEVTQENIMMMTPPLEDYCVVVDLEVEVPIRPVYGEIKEGNSVIYIRYTSAKNSDAKMSFFQGRRYAGSDSFYLTTEPNEMGTIHDISKDTQYTSSEMFGINSIDIEYNNYMVPIVTIQFTDIRGLSLFGAEDMRHNVTSSNGIDYSENSDIAGSFFKCFFTFPYPKFKITVKGFYGNPVSYELTCSDFRANFDSSTGNFGATAKFVGYSFSVFNDLTMASLLASPYSEYYGKKYWADNAQRFVFEDGTPMRPLIEVMKGIKGAMALLGKTEDNTEITDLQNKITNVENVKKAHDSYWRTLKEVVSKLDTSKAQYLVGDNYRIATKFEINDSTELNAAYNTLISSINELSGALSTPAMFGTRQDINKINYSDYNQTNDTVIQKFKENNSKYYWYYDGSVLIKETDNLITQYKTSLNKKESELDAQRNDEIEKLLGFKPSVKNVTELILAHVETFINEVYACAEDVSRLSRTQVPNYRIDYSDNGNTFYAFPLVTDSITENGVTKMEKSWIGRYDITAPEAQLVNSLLNATEDINKVVTAIQNEIIETKSNTIFLPNVEVPTIPSDFIGNTKPYANVDFSNNDDLCGKILARALVVDESIPKRINYLETLREIGDADARNFYKSNPKVSSNFRTKVKVGGTFTTDNVINLLSDVTRSVSVLSNGVDAVWKTSDKDSNALLPYVKGSEAVANFFLDGSQKRCAIPLGEFEWGTIKQSINNLVKEGTNNENAYYTRGFSTSNDNVFKIEVDNLEKYINYKNEIIETNYPNLKKLYDLTCQSDENINGLYDVLSAYYDNVIYGSNKSKLTQQVGNLASNVNIYSNVAFPTILPSNLLDKISLNGVCVVNSNDSNIEISNTNTTISLSNINQEDFPSVIENYDSDYVYNFFSGYVDGKISNKISIFGQDDFYRVLFRVGDYAAALMLLSTFKWNFNGFTKVVLSEYKVFHYMPYLMAVTVGGYYYRYDNLEKFNYNKISGDTLDFFGYKSEITEMLDGSSFPDTFFTVLDEVKESFKKLFIDWVSTDFNKIKNSFILHTQNYGEGVDNNPASLIRTLSTKLKEDENFAKASKIIPFLRSHLRADFFENYMMIQLSEDSNRGGFKLIHRSNSSAVKEFTQNLLKPCLIINGCANPQKVKNSFLSTINEQYLRTYVESFINGLRTYMPEDNTTTTTNIIENSRTADLIKISLYNYLKIIWDKWLSGNPKKGGQTIWDLDKIKPNWHYLDSFYNKLGDKATVNAFDLVADISDAFTTIGSSALSVMSTTYARNRYILLCVQNFVSMVDDKFMKDVFKAIPFNSIDMESIKSVPDFIVMYTNEPSSRLDIPSAHEKDDSFMLGGEDEQLPQPILSKTTESGYKIPAIGVTYGGQYQSYFYNIQVGMENPQVTDQSLQAQFAIANASNGDGGEGEVRPVGQDLFTIYANQSFTCTVDMMGCAWIQPLMYFQLNNVPMFKGSYLIQKVKHRITPGNMTTSFTGTRMSKYSTTLVDNGLLVKHSTRESDSYGIASDRDAKIAKLSNNCKYKYYNPIVDNGENGIPIEILNMSVADYGKQYGKDGKWNIDKLNGYTNKTMLEFLVDVGYTEVGGLDDLSFKLVFNVLYNRYMSANKNFTKVFYNSAQHSFDRGCPQDQLEKYKKIATDVFVKTPITLVGEETYVRVADGDPRVPIWDKGEKTSDYTTPKVIELDDVKKMDAYCTTRGYNTNITRRTDKLEPIPPSKNAFWHRGEYILEHDTPNRYGHVLVGSGWPNQAVGAEHWQVKTNTNSKTNSNGKLAKSLFDSIKRTIEYSEVLDIPDLKMEFVNESQGIFNVWCSSLDGNAQIFDIVLNTYYDHFSTLCWVTDNASNDLPNKIRIKVQKTVSKRVYLGKSNGGSTPIPFTNYNELHELFYISIKKKYADTLMNNDKIFKTECSNFTPITSADGWFEIVNGILSKYSIDECSSHSSGDGYNWDGINNEQDRQQPVAPKNRSLNVEKMVEYLFKHCNPKSQSKCAAYVRTAIESPEGGNMDINNNPLSACCYVKHLPVWGFKLVGEGESKTKPSNYTPQNGDICVIACNPAHKYGHIQVYRAEDGKWYSDFAANTMWCYPDEGRPYKIFRWINNG